MYHISTFYFWYMIYIYFSDYNLNNNLQFCKATDLQGKQKS